MTTNWKQESLEKLAVNTAPNDSDVEKTFMDLAFQTVANNAGDLMDQKYRCGFEIVKKNPSNTKLLGMFGFKVVNELYYVPVMYIDGTLGGGDMIYKKDTKKFVPLNPEQASWIISHKEVVLGEPVDKSMRSDTRDTMDLLSLINQPQMLGGGAIKPASDQRWNSAGNLAAVSEEWETQINDLTIGIKLAKLDNNPLEKMFRDPLCGDRAKAAFTQMIVSSPEFLDACKDRFSDNIWNAYNARTTPSEAAKAAAVGYSDLVIETDIPETSFFDRNEKLFSNGYSITDNRDKNILSNVVIDFPDAECEYTKETTGFHTVYTMGGDKKNVLFMPLTFSDLDNAKEWAAYTGGNLSVALTVKRENDYPHAAPAIYGSLALAIGSDGTLTEINDDEGYEDNPRYARKDLNNAILVDKVTPFNLNDAVFKDRPVLGKFNLAVHKGLEHAIFLGKVTDKGRRDSGMRIYRVSYDHKRPDREDRDNIISDGGRNVESQFLYNPDYSGMLNRAGVIGNAYKFVAIDIEGKGDSPVGRQDAFPPLRLRDVVIPAKGAGTEKQSLVTFNDVRSGAVGSATRIRVGKVGDNEFRYFYNSNEMEVPMSKTDILHKLARDLMIAGDTVEAIMDGLNAEKELDIYVTPSAKMASQIVWEAFPEFREGYDNKIAVPVEIARTIPVSMHKAYDDVPPNSRLGDKVDPEGGTNKPKPEITDGDIIVRTPEELVEMSREMSDPFVFEQGVVATLADTFDSIALVDSYLKPLEEGLDALERIKFLMIWKPEDFDDAYGPEMAINMRQQIGSNCDSLGEIVLKLKKQEDRLSAGGKLNARKL